MPPTICDSRSRIGTDLEKCTLIRLHEGDHIGPTRTWKRDARGRKANTVVGPPPAEWLEEALFLMNQGCSAWEIAKALDRKTSSIATAARRLNDPQKYALLILFMDTETALSRRVQPWGWDQRGEVA